MVAIPTSTQQKGKTPFLASPQALQTQQLAGFRSSAIPDGSFNTAIGAGALLFNTEDENTAFGTATLLFNPDGAQNTAIGTAALLNHSTGNHNTANGAFALSATPMARSIRL